MPNFIEIGGGGAKVKFFPIYLIVKLLIPFWDITINDFRDCSDRNSVIGKPVKNRFFSLFGVPAYVTTHYAYQTSAFKPGII